MLKRLTERSLRRVILSAFAGAVLLAGCDQISNRIDRAKDIAGTSAGQISGETVADASPNYLETAATADRALAGTVMAEFVVDDEERPVYHTAGGRSRTRATCCRLGRCDCPSQRDPSRSIENPPEHR